jgi:hypothetical protein
MHFISLFLFICLSLFGTCQPDTFSKFPNEYFVETGSAQGYGIEAALKSGFKNVRSIDINPQYYELCMQKFSSNSSVKLFLGDSSEGLFDVISDINFPITFWLDAHIATGETGCPILQELEVIEKHPVKNHTILIDDVRLFGTYHFDFIPLSRVVDKIMEINPNYQISYTDGFVINDILVAEIK